MNFAGFLVNPAQSQPMSSRRSAFRIAGKREGWTGGGHLPEAWHSVCSDVSKQIAVWSPVVQRHPKRSRSVVFRVRKNREVRRQKRYGINTPTKR